MKSNNCAKKFSMVTQRIKIKIRYSLKIFKNKKVSGLVLCDTLYKQLFVFHFKFRCIVVFINYAGI